ncbi:hypothetical protein RMCBS344292_03040 [Rhizopus microsporus]|nr:hypothetical protein RMCBS344292_03040 [Rhizopus microsporus]
MTRARGRSVSQQPADDELTAIDKQFEFINTEFKYNVHDLDAMITLLRARLSAEEMYISALLKAKKATSIYESDKAPSYEFQFTFYQAVKAYESSIYSLIESRQIVRDTIKKEIDKLVQQREHEEATRKTYKTKLAEANSNYTNYRNRDIVKLTAIDKQFEFINTEFKYNVHDLDAMITLLRARLSAEEMYISALLKAKKATSIYESDKAPSYEFQFTFYQAVKAYESSIYSLIESRQIVRDTIKKEIDKLVQQREHEEATRKTYKTKLAEANSNYTNYRNRDIVKLQKLYTHKCEDLKNAQTTYQAQQLQIQQQQLHANEESNDDHKLSRNSLEASRLSGEYGSIKDLDGNSDQHNKKGMAGLFSQMRTIASSGGSYLSSVDQNKQISKFAKMKKDIAEADSEYRDGILILEALRKKQRKAVEETNWQVKNTIKRKTEGIKSSLLAIIMAEMESLRIETEV